MTQIINRDAADKTKGFRLQKLRAATLLLRAANDLSNVNFYYAAIEAEEDVTIIKTVNSITDQMIEEDKNYSPDSNFTIHSEAVLNTLVSFFDIYIGKWHRSPSTVFTFSFYTTTNFGKEKKKELADRTIIELPDRPILEILQSSSDIPDNIASVVKTILLVEYKKQYEKIPGNGYLKALEEIDLEQFKIFLKKISWLSGQEDELELQRSAETLIKCCKYYQLSMSGKEQLILAKILDKIDEKQHFKDFAERFINSAEVELIFKMAESEVSEQLLDPIWKELQELSANIIDKRNLEEKLLDSCPTYPKSKIATLARKACSSKTEEEASNKSFLSLKYRVFEACEDYFFDNEKFSNTVNQTSIDATIKSLQKKAADTIEELKKDYTYTVSNKETINGIVINLIDSCFICFDEDKSE
ncbi:hypothetical protein HXW87_19060 [Pseudomonas sp. Y5-11]|jgi:hypothetical protein|uniref:hypothetical protein n=1 Tax=Pseudomonas sp. Y5-11 TaxID=2749808 RepID=UPI001EFAC2CC|nr:hypothetical protein [Pseudomonas sp. Y5-11]ULN84192.1 hypothetical protein HXW87_19060 [Pseudomonas sp. Y5-11]